MQIVREQFPHDPTSARGARRFVAAALDEAGFDAIVDSAQLLVSELIANVYLHTASDAEVMVAIDGSAVTVEVRDGSSALPISKHYGTDATTGRGVRFLELLATSWGAERDDAGKRVWFMLDLRASAETGDGDQDAENVDLDALAASFGEKAQPGRGPVGLRRAA